GPGVAPAQRQRPRGVFRTRRAGTDHGRRAPRKGHPTPRARVAYDEAPALRLRLREADSAPSWTRTRSRSRESSVNHRATAMTSRPADSRGASPFGARSRREGAVRRGPPDGEPPGETI